MPQYSFRGKTYNNPVELTESILGGKWKMPILWRLRERPWRYNELQRNLKKVTPKMLTEQLRELERDGLINRKVFAVIPPKVEYTLTEQGRTTIPVIEVLREWGVRYRERAEKTTRQKASSQKPVSAS